MKKKKAKPSLYQSLAGEIQKGLRRQSREISLGHVIRDLRIEKKLRGVDLCLRAGNMDPRTLTAIEKGRIKTPSLKSLQFLASGLGISVSDLFRCAEADDVLSYETGSQKGFYEGHFRSFGVKVISLTPFVGDFFCGKMVLAPKRRFQEKLLSHPFPIFASALVGRFEVLLEGKNLTLNEGQNVFFRGNLRHSFYNPLQRESVLLLMTAPSFFKPAVH